jgi:hypothetical protein
MKVYYKGIEKAMYTGLHEVQDLSDWVAEMTNQKEL